MYMQVWGMRILISLSYYFFISKTSYYVRDSKSGMADYTAATVTLIPQVSHSNSTKSCTRDGHYLELLPPTEKKLRPRRRCRVCIHKGQRKDTQFFCPTCPGTPALCAGECFTEFHGLQQSQIGHFIKCVSIYMIQSNYLLPSVHHVHYISPWTFMGAKFGYFCYFKCINKVELAKSIM